MSGRELGADQGSVLLLPDPSQYLTMSSAGHTGLLGWRRPASNMSDVAAAAAAAGVDSGSDLAVVYVTVRASLPHPLQHPHLSRCGPQSHRLLAALVTCHGGCPRGLQVPSRDVGQKLGRALVERQLAACVNIVPGVAMVCCWCVAEQVVLRRQWLVWVPALPSALEDRQLAACVNTVQGQVY